jgi:hypothetical protein
VCDSEYAQNFSKYRDKQPRLVSFKSAQSCEVSVAFEDQKTGKIGSKLPFHIETVCSEPFLAQGRLETAEKRLKDG